MHRNISLTAGIAFVLLVVAGATMAACGGSNEAKPTSTAVTSKTPAARVTTAAGATSAAPTQIPVETASSDVGFGCPAQWEKYSCPTVSGPALILTAPFRAGVDAEMMCQNVGFYTSGVTNDNSILFKLPPGTEIVSPVDGTVVSIKSMPAPHEDSKSISIGGMPFLIYVYFVGDIKVEANALLTRGDVVGVSTGTFPTDSPPDSKLNGASVLINLLGKDSKMLDASSSDLWVGGVPSCYVP
jgi:hypothetical protein